MSLEDDIRRIAREELKKEVQVHQDSVEMDTPSKGGALKVYFNASNIGETKIRMDNALEARAYLKDRAAGVVAPQQPICDTCELDGHCEIQHKEGKQYIDCSVHQDKKR